MNNTTEDIEIFENFLSTKQGKKYQQTMVQWKELYDKTMQSIDIKLHTQLKKLERKEIQQRIKWVLSNEGIGNTKWYKLQDYIIK